MAKPNQNTQLDVTNKMSLSVGSSTNDKNYFEETLSWIPQLHADDIFADTVPWASNPVSADANVAANPTILQKLADYQMDEIPLSNGQGYSLYTTPGNTSSARLYDFVVPQKYGPGYAFTLKDGANNPIALTAGAYQFDYANGVMRFDDAHTPAIMGWTLPLKLTVYQYIGAKLSAGTGGGYVPRDPVNLFDDTSTARPTVDPSTIDGAVVQDGWEVLFSNLSNGAENNRVWIADTTTTPGTILWTLRPDGRSGNGDPTEADEILVTDGNRASHLVAYNGTDWVVIATGSFNLTVEEQDGIPTGSNINKIVLMDYASNSVFIDGQTAYLHAPPPPIPLTGTNILSNATFFTGALSVGNTNYKGADPAGSVVNYIVNMANAPMQLTHDPLAYQAADIGLTEFIANGAAVRSIDMAINFQEANRYGSQIITNYDTQGTGDPVTDGQADFPTPADGNLKIDSVSWTNSIGSSIYQKGTAEVNILDATWWRQGYSGVQIGHNSANSNVLDVFVDTDVGADPTVASLDLLLTLGSQRYLSGVPYYDTGSIFSASMVGNDCFDNVYHASGAPIVVDGFPGVASAGIMYNDASVSGVTNPPTISDVMTVSGYTFTLPAGQQNLDVRITATPRDPYGSYVAVQSPSHGYSVNSLPSASTRVMEYFQDEDYRWRNNTNFNTPPGALTGDWDSTETIWDSGGSGTAGYSNALQVYDEDNSPNQRCLRHPGVDYSTARAPVGPDYSPLNGNVNYEYYRVFQGTIDNSNGIIAVPGLADIDLSSGNIQILIKVPSKTMWLDMWTDFNGGTFPTQAAYPGGTDGEGCRINPTVHSPNLDGTLEFTLGTYGSDASVNRTLFVKIIYANNAATKLLSGFGITNW